MYHEEENTSFAPPGKVYPIVWTSLYIAMGSWLLNTTKE
ncbi:tryptophan-rich sensory protein [Staphylococcus simulans]|nr:tryptophan-rich sensory protein [Staphylococcus simulans]